MKSKLAFIADIVSQVIRNPASLYQVLTPPAEDGRYSESYVQNKFGINRLPSVNLLDLLPTLEETLTHYSYLPGTSMTIDIALLMGLARNKNNCNYLEIGSWRGESLANVASTAKHCTSITLGIEQMNALGFSEKQIELHGFYSKGIPNIDTIHADSTKFDFGTLNQKFDLIFIDGDHRKASIESDTRNAFSILNNEHSIIVWHDYSWDTERVRYNTLAGILDGCTNEAERAKIFHVAQTKCAIYWPREVETSHKTRHELPQVNFDVTIKARKI